MHQRVRDHHPTHESPVGYGAEVINELRRGHRRDPLEPLMRIAVLEVGDSRLPVSEVVVHPFDMVYYRLN